MESRNEGDSMPQKEPAIIRLREELWERISRLIPAPQGRGRRPSNNKGCFEGLLYLLRTGCQWSELPKVYPPKSTVHDALQRWAEMGLLEQMWSEALLEFDDLKGLEWEWLSADSASTKAPLGGGETGKKSDGPRQKRHKAPHPDRGPGHPDCAGGQWRKRA